MDRYENESQEQCQDIKDVYVKWNVSHKVSTSSMCMNTRTPSSESVKCDANARTLHKSNKRRQIS